MSTASSVNSSASSALSLLRSFAASTGSKSTSATSAQSDAATQTEDDSAVTVNLSDQAKALLDRAKIAQAVADRLAQHFQIARDTNGSDWLSKLLSQPTSAGKTRADKDSSDQKTSSAASSTSAAAKWKASLKEQVTVSDAPAPYGDSAKSDQQIIKEMTTSLLATADLYDNYLSPGSGQPLRDALAKGTIKVQNAADVAGLNMHSTQTWTPNAFGSVDGSSSTTITPTGSVKEAFESGRSLALWSADRGNIYLSW